MNVQDYIFIEMLIYFAIWVYVVFHLYYAENYKKFIKLFYFVLACMITLVGVSAFFGYLRLF